jgi:asparagine synthase (glutamine-hydrolysing)
MAFLAIHSPDPAMLHLRCAQAKLRHRLAVIFEGGSLVVLSSDGASIPIGKEGLIIGSLFRREGESRAITSLSAGAALAISSSGGNHLLKKFWGGYVAFVDQPHVGWVVLRDPSGQMPCFLRQDHEAVLVASESRLLFAQDRDAPGVDWPALGYHLTRITEPSRSTALVGVEEIQPGERTALRQPGTREQAWSPWGFAAREASADSDALAMIVEDCCRAWALTVEEICLTLSGGFDSSVMAACLAGRDRLACLNFLTPTPDGDETRYAGSVARHFDIDLHIEPLRLGAIALDRSTTEHEPRPAGRMIGHATDAAALTMLGSSPDGALFNGEGGDAVFCFLSSPLPAIDRLLRQGPGLGFWSSWMDTSRLTRTSLARSGRWMLSRLVGRSQPPRWGHNALFLSRDVIETSSPDARPHWLSPPPGILPGKAAHVRAIFRGQTRKRRLPDGRPIISPLMSQPILEQVLAIPTWCWCEDGRDRSLARRAFASRLPASITGRRSKGGPDGFALELITSRREELRERLLDGNLAANGLIDRDAIAAELSGEKPAQGVSYLRILELAEAEAWAICWQAGGLVTPEPLRARPSNPAIEPPPPVT